MTEEVKQRKTIASVIKAIDVINYISQSEKEQGVTEISEALNLGVSATYHLLNTLRETNIIVQNEKTKKFKLSLKLWQIGMLAYGQNHISISLKPFIKKLKELTGETANLTVLNNTEIVYIAQEESDRLIKMFTKEGASAPLHCTAAGKILLAYQNEDKRNSILDKLEFTKYTYNTIVEKDVFIKELEKIKEQGYGFDEEERDMDVTCVGAPIFGINDEIIACISISGPKSRFNAANKKLWIPMVVGVAREASDFMKSID